jgi:hypothetical protein
MKLNGENIKINNMRNLSEYINESNQDTKGIEKFLDENFRIKGNVKISNKDNKYEVSVKGHVVSKNENLTTLTNGEFIWDEVTGDFSLVGCKLLKTLEGCPKKIGDRLDCAFCKSLESLKGCPEELESIILIECNSLKTLEDGPKIVNKLYDVWGCKYLTRKDVAANCTVKGRIEGKLK